MELPHMHKDHHHGPHYWASWCSPVGLGIFFVTTAIGAAVAVYTILSLITGIMTLTHPAPAYSYPVGGMTLPADSSNVGAPEGAAAE